MTKLIATEEQEQISLMSWAMLHPICKDYLIHIPNEGKRTQYYGRKLKLLGLKPGVSDLFLAYPTPTFSGLWLEMKRKSKRCIITDTQQQWIHKMNAVGYAAYVAHGWEEAKNIIEDYLK